MFHTFVPPRNLMVDNSIPFAFTLLFFWFILCYYGNEGGLSIMTMQSTVAHSLDVTMQRVSVSYQKR